MYNSPSNIMQIYASLQSDFEKTDDSNQVDHVTYRLHGPASNDHGPRFLDHSGEMYGGVQQQELQTGPAQQVWNNTEMTLRNNRTQMTLRNLKHTKNTQNTYI